MGGSFDGSYSNIQDSSLFNVDIIKLEGTVADMLHRVGNSVDVTETFAEFTFNPASAQTSTYSLSYEVVNTDLTAAPAWIYVTDKTITIDAGSAPII